MNTRVSKARAFVFTLNNHQLDEIDPIKKLNTDYQIIGDEVGESGTPHLQGYLHFSSSVSFKTIQKAIPRAHIEVAKGSASSNRTYCSKEKVLHEAGTIPTQGKRTDIDAVKEQLADTGLMRDVVLIAKSTQSIAIAKEILTYHERKRDHEPNIIWNWGPTGCGKSHNARHGHPDPYYCGNSAKWWQGYDAHEYVVIDDFRASFITYNELLRLTDKYPFIIEYKGGSRQFLAETIVITCPYHPLKVFDTIEDKKQLLRRISQICHYHTKHQWPTIETTDDLGNINPPDESDVNWMIDN